MTNSIIKDIQNHDFGLHTDTNGNSIIKQILYKIVKHIRKW